jgi:hypothetical protein
MLQLAGWCLNPCSLILHLADRPSCSYQWSVRTLLRRPAFQPEKKPMLAVHAPPRRVALQLCLRPRSPRDGVGEETTEEHTAYEAPNRPLPTVILEFCFVKSVTLLSFFLWFCPPLCVHHGKEMATPLCVHIWAVLVTESHLRNYTSVVVHRTNCQCGPPSYVIRPGTTTDITMS